jgi:integrase
MQIRFTEPVLKQLKLPKGMKDQQWFDKSLPGFGFRLFASGKANYFIKYKMGKQQRRVTIGPYVPGILAEMRQQAAGIINQVRCGVDVQQEKSSERAEINAPLTDVIELYLKARQPEVSADWHRELTTYLRRAWQPFHDCPLRALERGALVRQLDKIAHERGRVTADHSRKALSGLFGWAVDRRYVSANPLLRLKRYQIGNGRKRALTIRELIAVWKARGHDDFSRIVGLLLLALQRKEEISDLVWSEVDIEGELEIRLPGARTKNGHAHRIPISPLARAILEDVPRHQERDFLFGEGQKGFQGWSKSKARFDVLVCRLLAPDHMAQLEDRTGDLTRIQNRQAADAVAEQFGHPSITALLQSIMPH